MGNLKHVMKGILEILTCQIVVCLNVLLIQDHHFIESIKGITYCERNFLV